MSCDSSQFESVCATAREAALFQSSADALEWDERTGMPPAAGAYRAEQISKLRAVAHELRTDRAYGDRLTQLLEECSDLDPNADEASTILHLHRDFERDCKLPTELVHRISQATVRGQQVWDRARKADSFADFSSSLADVIALKREAGERIAEGTDRSAYEALLDEYEPGAKIATLVPMFKELKSELAQLLVRANESKSPPDLAVLQRDFEVNHQRSLSRIVAESVGFDFQAGRLDETSHPFCTTLGPSDCRILSRYEKNWLPGGLYGTLHEAGHGMYEQGLRSDWFGLPPGSYVSLGIHESQSRLWENQVGRSESFCQWLLPHLQRHFPEVTKGLSSRELFRAVNVVRPSLIRVEADEATYNLHIAIRFELEQQLLTGELPVNDLPAAWNAQYEQTLGIQPESDANGVLQDVHWSAGLIGYFPTYTLGNLVAAQLFDAASEQIGDLDQQIERGDFEALLTWLRSKIHVHGRNFTSQQLVENATGKPLSAEPLINGLRSKIDDVYR